MAVDVHSDIAGSVWQIPAPLGTTVSAGDDVIVLESMKMEVPVGAPCDGVVSEVLVEPGAAVDEGDLLFRIEAG